MFDDDNDDDNINKIDFIIFPTQPLELMFC